MACEGAHRIYMLSVDWVGMVERGGGSGGGAVDKSEALCTPHHSAFGTNKEGGDNMRTRGRALKPEPVVEVAVEEATSATAKVNAPTWIVYRQFVALSRCVNVGLESWRRPPLSALYAASPSNGGFALVISYFPELLFLSFDPVALSYIAFFSSSSHLPLFFPPSKNYFVSEGGGNCCRGSG